MQISKLIEKREFIQYTSRYLKWVDENGSQLIITHHNQPDLVLTKIKLKTLKELRGSVIVKEHADINESVLPEYDQLNLGI